MRKDNCMKIQHALGLLKEDPYFDQAHRQYTIYKNMGGTLLDAHEFLKLFVRDYDARHIIKIEKQLLEKNKTQKKSKESVKNQLMDEFLVG